MARRVFLHIGSPKSGTTYLQDILWKNKRRLADQGVLLPARRVDNFHATMIIREIPGLHKRIPSAPTAWSRIVAETREWAETAIISHEFFGGASAEQAKRALDDLHPAEVHLIVTARDYVRVMPAAWQQWVKTRYGGTLTEFIHGDADGGPRSEWGWRTADVVAMLDRWGRHVPPERVHVVTVPQPGASPDLLWQRFAGLCGIDPDSCDPAGARPNESLGVVEVELMRRITPKIIEPIKDSPADVTRWVRDMLAHQVLAPRRGERFGLAPDDASFLREKSREAADQLSTAGYDVVGSLAELIPPDDDPQLSHPDTVTDADLVEAGTDVIAEMLQYCRRESLRADRERQRADQAKRALAQDRRRPGAIDQQGNGFRPRVKARLIDLSERRGWVMRARLGYSRAINGIRRLRRPHSRFSSAGSGAD